MGFQAIFKTAFPFISAAASLGGPLGTMAANAVGKAIGVDNVAPDAVPDAIAAATSKDPDAMLKLKQAEDAFQVQMQQLGFENAQKLLDIDASDRANARAREIAVKDRTPSNLAYIVTGGFFGLLLLLAFHEVPAGVHDLLLVMLGALAGAFMGQQTYYFGSSAGSAEKTKMLSQGKP
jgi:hypothetical protein